MKKTILTISFVLLFAAVSSAQVSTPVSLYLGGLMSAPASADFNDDFKWGYHGWAGVGYKMMPSLQVLGKVEYHDFFFDMADLTGLEGGDTKVWMYGVDGRYTLNIPMFPIKPFILAGGGLARVSWDEFEGTSLIASTLNENIPEPVSKVYFNFGGGLNFKIIPALSFFAEARYVSVATEGGKTSYIPMSIGLRFF
ncbi:MAG: outer membrane beta-barrel protein [Candidatus Zixiibacteriota bacterium]|nr:MAG: outer membrane beta-barrel protein [candidate division Zixibacteria bacterium]